MSVLFLHLVPMPGETRKWDIPSRSNLGTRYFMICSLPSGKLTVCELENCHRNSGFNHSTNGDLNHSHVAVRGYPSGGPYGWEDLHQSNFEATVQPHFVSEFGRNSTRTTSKILPSGNQIWQRKGYPFLGDVPISNPPLKIFEPLLMTGRCYIIHGQAARSWWDILTFLHIIKWWEYLE